MSCLHALPTGFVPGWGPVEESDTACLAAEVEVAGRLGYTVPDLGVSLALDPTRARVSVAVADGPARAAVRLAAVRSAGDQGYLGLDGEAYAAEVDGAVVGVGSADYGLHGEVGIVPDLWIAGADRAWDLAGSFATLGAATGWMERADVGAQGGIVAPGGWGALDVALTTGEGFAIRERNEGKDVAVSVSVAPLARGEHPRGLVLTAYGRDGSRGIAVAPNSRIGGRVAGEWPRVAFGLEVLAARGVDADAERHPVGESVFVRGAPLEPLYLVGRWDRWAEGDAVAWSALAAAGARIARERSRVVALAGVSRTDLGELGPAPGSVALSAGTTWFVQIDGALRASVSEGS